MVPSAPSVFPTPPTGEAWHLKSLFLFHRLVFLGSDPQKATHAQEHPGHPSGSLVPIRGAEFLS